MNRTRIATAHGHPEIVAAAVAPDNTPQLHTRVEDGAVVTDIERATVGGLRATVGDYLRAIAVADETVRLVTAEAEGSP